MKNTACVVASPQVGFGALNFVYGAMVGYQAEDGSNPLEAVNIERLISALRLLQSAKDHEVAPFVASWKAGATGVDPPALDRLFGRRVLDAVKRGTRNSASFAETDAVEAIAAIARAATATGDARAFAQAEEHILEDLREILGHLKTVEYLHPLADFARRQPGGLDVVTLNYDLAIERMSSETGTEVDRGIERSRPGIPLSFANYEDCQRNGNLILVDSPRVACRQGLVMVWTLEPVTGEVDSRLVAEQMVGREVRAAPSRASRPEDSAVVHFVRMQGLSGGYCCRRRRVKLTARRHFGAAGEEHEMALPGARSAATRRRTALSTATERVVRSSSS